MASNTAERFRKNIAPLCKGKQEEIADKAGISRVFLNRILQGKSEPSLGIAENIAKAVGVSLDTATTCDSI